MKDMVQSKEIKKNTSIHILDILNFLGECVRSIQQVSF